MLTVLHLFLCSHRRFSACVTQILQTSYDANNHYDYFYTRVYPVKDPRTTKGRGLLLQWL